MDGEKNSSDKKVLSKGKSLKTPLSSGAYPKIFLGNLVVGLKDKVMFVEI